MKIVTAAEMREIDRLTTEKYGVPSLTLMENAGTAVAQFAQQQFDFNSVCVVCGKGNNGGDGFAAARKLKEAGKRVSVVILAKGAKDLRGDAAKMFKKLSVKPLWITAEKDFEQPQAQRLFQSELLIDAILGTGFKPPLQGLGLKAVELIDDSRVPVLAVDLPSGYDADQWWLAEKHARADAVVTFTAPKQVHAFAPIRGPMVVAPIGTPEEAVQSNLNLEWAGSKRNWFKVNRFVDAHKGEFGHVFVVGGSVGKAGAPSMTALAALKVGAGSVTACVPKSVLPTVAQIAPEVMTEPLAENEQGSISKKAADPIASQKKRAPLVAVVGPGLSTNPDTVSYVQQLVARCDVPIVIDADGLNAFAGRAGLLNGTQCPLVITPHLGEMSRLTGTSIKEIANNPMETARSFATRHHVHVVLKSWRTVIAHPDGRAHVSTTGNPGMAKGGSGDVLTGLIAGVLAQTRAVKGDIGDGVCAAVDLHGLSADIAVSRGSERTFMATDIIKYLPRAIRFIRSQQKFTWLRGLPRRT
jgi:NAD(P)H-hydrate epimerase